MSLFGNLTSDGLEETQDRLGGFTPLDSDIYTGKIKVAYAGQSQGGARSVTLSADLDNGKEYRETVYITNKDGQNYFLNKNDNSKKVPLPGFVTIDDLCLVTTGAPLAEQNTDEKVVNVYDPEQRKELPKSVPVLVDLIGKEASFGILRQKEFKSKKEGNEYVPTDEIRESNLIDKIFHTETHMTVVEARNGAENSTFWDSWLERNKGQTRDRTQDGNSGSGSGRPGANKTPPQAGQNQGEKRKSLFGK